MEYTNPNIKGGEQQYGQSMKNKNSESNIRIRSYYQPANKERRGL